MSATSSHGIVVSFFVGPDEPPHPVPLAIAVILPLASTVTLTFVYEPAVIPVGCKTAVMFCPDKVKPTSPESVTDTSHVFVPERFVAEMFPVNVAPDKEAFVLRVFCKSV